jgi:hypothetical protein
MGRTKDDVVTRESTGAIPDGGSIEEDEDREAYRDDNRRLEPVASVDEWQAEEAGYGYGV